MRKSLFSKTSVATAALVLTLGTAALPAPA